VYWAQLFAVAVNGMTRACSSVERLTGFRLLPQYWGRILGSFFYRGVSPSKIGLIAPCWETVHLRLKARVFLLGWNKPWMLRMGRTYAAKRRTLLKNWRAAFCNAHKRCESNLVHVLLREVWHDWKYLFSMKIRNRWIPLSIETDVIPVQITKVLDWEGVELKFDQSYHSEMITNPLGKHYIIS
jgi:hypothetical protein